jgi:mono/diheme cytochrome c family protein
VPRLVPQAEGGVLQARGRRRLSARGRGARAAALAAALALAAGGAAAQAPDDRVARGRAVLEASGGCTCHTDLDGGGPPLAGGRGISTPFGVYFAPNLTPDPETGIGRWSDADFLRAMREGVAPDGSSYFPVFPYTSFTGMSDEDLLALKAYLFSLAPVRRENRPHEAWPPFAWRVAAAAWRRLHFAPARFAPDPARPPAWNRGAYLVTAVAHCGECHTPRTLSGALDRSRWLAGAAEGPEGELAPNLTPHDDTGLGRWTRPDVVWYLQTGLRPDGDDAQGLMRELVEHGYQHVPRADLEAIALYLESLPPIENEEVSRAP